MRKQEEDGWTRWRGGFSEVSEPPPLPLKFLTFKERSLLVPARHQPSSLSSLHCGTYCLSRVQPSTHSVSASSASQNW